MSNEELAARIVTAIEAVLNDRKGYHLDCLDDEIREDFLNEMREVTLKELKRKEASHD